MESKELTSKELYDGITHDSSLIPTVIAGVDSSKASVRYGCSKVLMELSEEHPEELYPYFKSFEELLDSKYRILIWNATKIIANMCKVDEERKIDHALDKYFQLLSSGYLVTVANVVVSLGKIAQAKPYLADRIARELVKVESLALTPHMTEECRRVVAERAVGSFNLFFEHVSEKDLVFSFVERHRWSL